MELSYWQQCLEYLQEDLPTKQFNTWLRPVQARIDDGELVLLVPNSFVLDHIEKNFLAKIIDTIKTLGCTDTKVRLTIGSIKHSSEASNKTTIQKPVAQNKPKTVNFLNPAFTFKNFVEGKSNQLAKAAALQVSENSGKAYNPLFIYGDVGLGKTHLMQAIGHFVMSKNPKKKIVYISSEKFTNQFIDAIGNGKINQFRRKYRNTDILLIDDIHFIAGKESTQEEFFHTFNDLYDAHKQIVISSDKPPKNIPVLEHRLISRFEWGLITDIQPPDLETRMAILQKKAEREGLSMPNDVTYLIADNIKNLTLKQGRILTDEEFRTSNKNIFAGGDCIYGGDDLTVTASANGREAAESIHASIS